MLRIFYEKWWVAVLMFIQVLSIKEIGLGSIIGNINDLSLMFESRSWEISWRIQILILGNVVIMLSFIGGLFNLLL